MSNSKKSVSIVTITQLKRNKCLKNLYEFILTQTYKNIIEWIIVEGSKSEKNAFLNKIFIQELQTLSTIPITYIEYNPDSKLSDLRNSGNNMCKGDIIICMDDDDYYPPLRVANVVDSLINSPAQIAGCSNIYMYEYTFNKLYQFKQFNKNHSTNNCLGFKREYLLTHSHMPGLDFGEEASFTNNFSEQMIQLDPLNCIIMSSHNTNTFDKKPLCSKQNKQIKEITDNIYNYISAEIINKINSALD
jgi:glycosyltransferase involved in cell wall biosynthesis